MFLSASSGNVVPIVYNPNKTFHSLIVSLFFQQFSALSQTRPGQTRPDLPLGTAQDSRRERKSRAAALKFPFIYPQRVAPVLVTVNVNTLD